MTCSELITLIGCPLISLRLVFDICLTSFGSSLSEKVTAKNILRKPSNRGSFAMTSKTKLVLVVIFKGEDIEWFEYLLVIRHFFALFL